jgi:anthranilate phosphoribosyltransferase
MKTLAPIRKELGVKTFINMLGPMVNPTQPHYQMVGVFSLELARLYAYLYQGSTKSYTILHDLGGYDEVSLTNSYKTFTPQGEKITTIQGLGFDKIDPELISGGNTVEDSAAIFNQVIDGDGTIEQNNVVLCNAAIAINTIHPDKSFADCFYIAEESLMSKNALKSFTTLLSIQ